MAADAGYFSNMVTSRPGTIHARVQEVVEGFSGRPFRVAEIVEALGLKRGQIKAPMWTLLRAGVISCVDEVKSNRHPGSREKIYQRAEVMGHASDAARIRGAVRRFSDRYEFTTSDVAHDLKINPTTVRIVLEALERSGTVVRMVDSRRPRGGFPAPRWTSEPDNMVRQRYLDGVGE
jgi:predicted ArsR family transcriptional regulator